jgi:MFS family permease
VPFYLIERRRFSVAVAGVIFTLMPLATTLAAPLAGRVADRVGAAVPLIAGLALEAIGLGTLAFAGLDTPIALVAAALFASGFGVGLFQVPMMALIMGAFPSALQGAAGGVAFMSRTLGIVSGVAVLAAILAGRRAAVGFDGAFTEAFMLATALVTAAAVIAAIRARRLRTHAPGA